MREVYTLEDLRDWPQASGGEPLKLAVFGDPVAHSASPPMHNAALTAAGLEARYCRLHIRPEELAEAFKLLPTQGFLGVNCTIPHKAAALPLMDRVDEHARRIGVVNTVVVRDRELTGFNTDGPGLVRAVRAEFGVDLHDLRVMVLGAGGGAGRAIAMQCGIESCPEIYLVNRRKEKAGALKMDMQAHWPGLANRVHVTPWEQPELKAAVGEVDMVINCTSLGMKDGDVSPLRSSILRKNLFLYDTIYKASCTPFTLAADEAGARSANGLSMLLHQGALSFEIWFDRPAPLAEMRAALLAHATSR